MRELPRIIAVDLDGTVFCEDHKTIMKRTYRILEECIRKGAQLVPTTGRCEDIIPIDNFPPVRYIISSNGGMISDRKTRQTLRSCYIPKRCVDAAWEIVKERVRQLNMVMEFFEDGQLVIEREIYNKIEQYASRLPRFHLSAIREGRAKCVSSFDEYLEKEGQHIVKINFPGSNIRNCPEVREEFIKTGFFEVTSDGGNLELTQSGCNKGEALMWLSDYLKMPRNQIVAFGDGNNDLSMIRCANWGVAMGNASDEVKSNARYRTASNTQDGIADFIVKRFFGSDYSEPSR